MRKMFNPFGKDFGDVKQADLEILRSVAEGWYVEYKKETPNGKKIAASVSSFANSHGGIYFIGIESDRSNNRAASFGGVVDSPDVIRDSVRGNLQPFPYFETFAIDLGNGRKILMVAIPEGDNPPYIHSDGRIYRRQEAASDPIAENNRYTIDELYQKAQEFKEELEEFRQFDLTFCKGEGKVPYLEMFVNTAPFDHFFIEDFFSKDNLKKLMNQFNASFIVEEEISSGKISFSGNLEFDSVNTYHNSISLRYLEGQDLAYNGTTLIVDVFGNLKLLIPLVAKYYSLENLLESLPERYLNVLSRSQERSISSIGLLGARQIAGAIFGVMSNYVKYLDEKHYKEAFEVKLRLTNCWRKTLYIDSETFMAHVENFGIPICMKSEQYFPIYPMTFKIDELKANPITKYLGVFSHVANALGVPSEVALASVIDEIRSNPQASSS